MMYINNRRFEWDDEKAVINFIKHGISFKEAITAFDDPTAVFEEDLAHSQQERRQRLIGISITGVVVIVVFTMRPFDMTRIISARAANWKERRNYEKNRWF